MAERRTGPGPVPVVAFAGCVLAAMPAAAINWTFTPRVTSSATFSDNVDLDPPGEEESATIYQLNPGFDLQGEGRRLDLSLNYTLQTLVRSSGDEGDEINHLLNGRADAELVRNTLFLDASVSRREVVDSLIGPVGVDNTTTNRNRRSVTTARVSPYLVNRFGTVGTSTLRYSHDRVLEEDGVDSHSNGANWQFASGPAFGRIDWSLNADYRRIEADRNESGTFRSTSARLGYRLGGHWRVSATGGYEDNDFETAGEDLSGSFWDVGATWTPNARTEMEARVGERYFGDTASLSVSHSRKRTVTSITYSETVTSDRQDRLVQAGTVPVFSGCTPATDPDCEPVDEITLFEIQQVNEFFEQRRALANVSFAGRRNSINLSAFRTERELLLSETDETQVGGNLGWTLSLGRRTRLSANAGYSRNGFSGSDREDDLYNASASVSRDFGQRLSGFLRLRHQRRDSSVDTADYRENAATVGLSASF